MKSSDPSSRLPLPMYLRVADKKIKGQQQKNQGQEDHPGIMRKSYQRPP